MEWNADTRQVSWVLQNFGVYWANLPDLFAGCFLLIFQRCRELPCATMGTAPLITHADNITQGACGAQTRAS